MNVIISYLTTVAVTLSDGIDVNNYFGYFAWLGPSWIFLVKTILGGVFLVTVVKVSKMGFSMYLQIKSGVKWW